MEEIGPRLKHLCYIVRDEGAIHVFVELLQQLCNARCAGRAQCAVPNEEIVAKIRSTDFSTIDYGEIANAYAREVERSDQLACKIQRMCALLGQRCAHTCMCVRIVHGWVHVHTDVEYTRC